MLSRGRRMSLLHIPSELLESILVLLASAGFPTTIAALAQTCRRLRNLIYHSADKHLWREIFLTTFDDPRLLKHHCAQDFDWGCHFRNRIWAERYVRWCTESPMHRFRSSKVYRLRSRARAISTITHVTSPYDPDKNTRALEALLSVISTAYPYSLHPSIVNTTSDTDLLGAAFSHYVAHTLTLSHMSEHTLIYPPSVHYEAATSTQSQNISWLGAVLTSGYPAALIAKLLTEKRDPVWERTEEAELLYKLVAYTGFIPIPVDESDDTAQTAPKEHQLRVGRGTQRGTGQHLPAQAPRSGTRRQPTPAPRTFVLDMDCKAQCGRTRIRARMHTYELDYLSRRRHWGPFRPVSSAACNSDAPSGPSTARGGHALSDDEDSEDSEFIPLGIEDGDKSDSDSDASSREPTPVPGPSRAHRPIPTSAELVPDWAWLASARIVAEANLVALNTDVFGNLTTDMSGLRDWNGLREGAWSREPDSEGKLKPKEDNAIGWDWAGAEGMWRRLVCWLDYSDLIHCNIHGGFDDPDMVEQKLIVPLRLRIVKYSPSIVPAYPDRPTIHLEGEMGGAAWAAADGENADFRKVHGTVEVITDGSVRWSIYSTYEGSNEDEWISEGVQLGGVGSLTGVLGLWTGVQHEGAEPIGPFWQWKVA